MDHDLAPSARPDCIVEMPARFAEPAAAAGRIAQRMLEIQRAGHAILGVLITGGEPLYGPMDVAKATIANAQNLAAFCGTPKLDAQKAVAGEFKRIFNGTLRSAMASLHDAFGGARVYLVFYEEGICAVVPAKTGHGRWRLASLRFLNAVTMDEERACVTANRASVHTYGIVWNTLVEIARREVQEDPGLRVDLMDEPASGGSSGGWRPEGDGRPDFPTEDDFANRDYDDPWADSIPDDRSAPPEPFNMDDRAPPEPFDKDDRGAPPEPFDPFDRDDSGSPPEPFDPWDTAPPHPAGPDADDRPGDHPDDDIDDQAVELDDPTDPSKGRSAPDPHDDDDADGMETINF